MLKLVVVQLMSALSLKVWPYVDPFFKKCRACALLLFILCMIAIAWVLSGCTTVGKPTRSPIYVYRADLWITIDGLGFDGTAVTLSSEPSIITVDSQVNLDRVEIETCARQDVCQNGKYCTPFFRIDKDWWGRPGARMSYEYIPMGKELGESCPLQIKAYDKKSLAAWGFVGFRNGEELPAIFTCNGRNKPWAGHSVCQTKNGLIQTITFQVPIEDFSADPECNIVKVNEKTFEIRPALGLCTGKFYAQGKFHGIAVIGYDETLIR